MGTLLSWTRLAVVQAVPAGVRYDPLPRAGGLIGVLLQPSSTTAVLVWTTILGCIAGITVAQPYVRKAHGPAAEANSEG